MRAFLLTTSAILALSMLPLLTQAKAQDVPEAAQSTTVEFIAIPDASDIRLMQWVGVPVKNSADETVGDVNDLVFSSAGQIKAIVVGVGGLIGIAEKNVAVRFEDAQMRHTGKNERTVVINATREEFKAAPEFKAAGEITAHDRLNEASEAVRSGYESVRERAIEGYNRAKEAMGGKNSPAPAE